MTKTNKRQAGTHTRGELLARLSVMQQVDSKGRRVIIHSPEERVGGGRY